MDDEARVRSVAETLSATRSWHQEQAAKWSDELREIDAELERLAVAIRDLHDQVESAQRHREDIEGRQVAFGSQVYESLFDVLTEQARALAGRSVEARDITSTRSEGMDSPEVKRLLEEYRTFKSQVAPTLPGLPESYRSVIQAHHDAVVARLKEHYALDAGPEPVGAEVLELDVVYAVDAPDGPAEMLMLVLPVSDAVFSRWADRGDDLELYFASRVVQGVHTVLAELGMVTVFPAYGGHQDLLAVEIELDRTDRGELSDLVRQMVGEVLASAPELNAARVQARPFEVPVDLLFPPEVFEDDEATAEEGR